MEDEQYRSLERYWLRQKILTTLSTFSPLCDFHWVIFACFKDQKKKPQTDSVLLGLLCDELSVFLTRKSVKLKDSFSHFIAGESGLQRFPVATICF